VTRLKDNADYGVVEEREIPQRKGVRRDQLIFFYKLAPAGGACFFRRVEYYNEEKDEVLVFLSNHLSLAAATVAAVYKERWAIELFFKALKRNLRVKTFVGTSENALQTQIWTALIALVADQVPATAGDVRLVAFQPAGPVTATTVRVPRPVDLDRPSLSTAAVDAYVGAIAVRARLEFDSNAIERWQFSSNVGKSTVRRRCQLRQHTSPERRFAMANLSQGRRRDGVLCALLSATARASPLN